MLRLRKLNSLKRNLLARSTATCLLIGIFMVTVINPTAYAETVPSDSNKETESTNTNRQNLIYKGHADDGATAKSRSWRRHYTNEERRTAKPIKPEKKNSVRGSEKKSDNVPKIFDLRTREEHIYSPDKVFPLLDKSNRDEQFPDEYEEKGRSDLKDSSSIERAQNQTTAIHPLEEGDDLYSTKSMSVNQSILDTTAYPYKSAVKLFFEKPDGAIYICSGALIDPSVVITAAHCVHDGEFNWYDGFEIIPAYNQRASGIAGPVIVSETPYGTANGGRVLSWRYGGLYGSEADIAVMELDRPVGTLAGWFGYGTANFCNILTDRQYISAGYPANDDRLAHCDTYNGSQMVSHNGTFDYCLSGEAYNFTLVSCGGQSGSGYWDSQTHIIRAIHSGFAGDDGRAAMIDSNEYDSILQFENETLSNTIDMIPTGMNVNGSLLGSTSLEVATGDQFQELKFTLLNHSTQAFNGSVEATFYLSSNKIISTLDTSLGTYNWAFLSLASNSSTTLYLTNPPWVPLGTPPGIYYIGIILDSTSGETNIANNTMDTEDVAAIQIVLPIPSDDNYEPNDTRSIAYNLSSHEWTWLSNINGPGIQSDEDWYEIYVSSGFERVYVSLTFSNIDGDIDLALYDALNQKLVDSTTTSDNELIDFVVPSGNKNYYLKVYYGDAGNSYDLWWNDIEPLVDGNCGSSHDVYFISKPTTNLCSAGSASIISGTGPWSWICHGSGGGGNANCSTRNASNNSTCATSIVSINNKRYLSDTIVKSQIGINSSGVVTIKPGINVEFSAPKIVLKSGFHAELGSLFSANGISIDCNGSPLL